MSPPVVHSPVATRADEAPPGSAIERALDPTRGPEGAVARAVGEARRASADALSALVGLDLARWWDGADDKRTLGHGRIASGALRDLDLAGAVASLLTHHDLGDGVLDGSSARLVRTAAGVDRDSVPPEAEARRRPAPSLPLRARGPGLVRALAGGASFKLRSVELASPPLEDLVEDVERVAGAPSGIMAYLSGPRAEGWGAHYDRHDGLIVQVEGTKRWRVHPPVERRPEPPFSPYRVDPRVVWEATLGPGDVVCIPRGWGHQVVGTDVTSLHVTIPVRRPTVADLLVDAARRGAALTGSSAGGRPPTPSALRDLLAVRRAGIGPRGRPALSELDAALEALSGAARGGPGALGPWAERRVRTSAPGGVVVAEAAESHTWFVVGRHRVPVDADAADLLARLLARPGVSLGSLGEAASAPYDRLGSWLASGLAVLMAPTRPAPPATQAARRRSARSLLGADPRSDGPGRPSVTGPSAWVRPLAGPAPSLRPADRSHPGEAGLSAAGDRARAAAADRLADLAGGFDLRLPMGDPAAAEPVLGHLSQGGSRLLVDPAPVDEVVARRELGGGRMAVAHEGRSLNRPPPADLFTSRVDPAAAVLVDPARLAARLRAGATAVLFGIDDSFPHLSEVAELVEATAGVRSGINAYVSVGDRSLGFGAHWDDHDVLVVQVQGTKTWALHRPLLPAPMRGVVADEVGGAPHRTVDLEPGDLLYVPRGWGHRVTGRSGVSIHYTFPLRTPVAAAVLGESGDGVGAARVAQVRWRSAIPSRARSHPAMVAAAVAGDPTVRVRLSAPGGVAVAGRRGDGLTLVMAGHLVEVAPTALEAMVTLLGGPPMALGDMGDKALLLAWALVDAEVAELVEGQRPGPW